MIAFIDANLINAKLPHSQVKFYPKVKSQTGLSSLGISLNVLCEVYSERLGHCSVAVCESFFFQSVFTIFNLQLHRYIVATLLDIFN